MKTWHLLPWVLLIVFGCGNLPKYGQAPVEQNLFLPASYQPDDIVITEMSKDVRSFHIIDKVIVKKLAMNKAQGIDLFPKLKNEAIDKGADAVINCQSNVFFDGTGEHKWATGYLVEYSDHSILRPLTFTISILPAHYMPAADSLKVIQDDELDEILFNGAQYYFEINGFYTKRSHDSLALADLNNLDGSSAQKIGEMGTNFLCLMVLNKIKSRNLGIYKSNAIDLDVMIISKNTAEVVWKNSAKGKVSLGGFGPILINSINPRKKEEAVNKMFGNLFKLPLPNNPDYAKISLSPIPTLIEEK